MLAGCGSKLTPENLTKVNAGMTQAEVREILGTPTEVRTQSVGPIEGSVLLYRKGESEVSLLFVNDKLVNKNGKFSE